MKNRAFIDTNVVENCTQCWRSRECDGEMTCNIAPIRRRETWLENKDGLTDTCPKIKEKPCVIQTISDADFAMMCDEMDTLRLTLGSLEADYAKLVVERDLAVKRVAALRVMAGYIEDGSHETLHISQDDCTKTWVLSVGKTSIFSEHSLNSLLDELIKHIKGEVK